MGDHFRQMTVQFFEFSLGNVGIFHGQYTADTAAIAGIQFDKRQVGKFFIFQVFQNADDIINTVCCQIVIGDDTGSFTRCV